MDKKSPQPIIILLSMFLFLSLNLFSQSQVTHPPFFFIQLTDPQFGMFEKNKGFDKETALFEKAIAEINRLKPDFVVITGDFVNDPDNESQTNEFKRILAKTDAEIPVYLIPGNHDVGQFPDEESLARLMLNYGYDRFSFIHKGTRFIGYNSSLIKADLPDLENEQFRWLKKELRKDSRNINFAVLFGHYPFFTDSADEPEKYSNIHPGKRNKYLKLFNKNKVSAVFFGHYHRNAYPVYTETEFVITSAVGEQHGNDSSGFRIIKVFNDRIEHDYFGFDEVPDKVLFD